MMVSKECAYLGENLDEDIFFNGKLVENCFSDIGSSQFCSFCTSTRNYFYWLGLWIHQGFRSVGKLKNFIVGRISLTLFILLLFYLSLVKMSNGNRGIFRVKKEDTDCRGILQWREIFWKWCLENWIKKSSGFIQLFRWFAWKATFAFFCQIIFEGISISWLGTRLSRIFCF